MQVLSESTHSLKSLFDSPAATLEQKKQSLAKSICSTEDQMKRSHHVCHHEAQRTGWSQIVPICWDRREDPKTVGFARMILLFLSRADPASHTSSETRPTSWQYLPTSAGCSPASRRSVSSYHRARYPRGNEAKSLTSQVLSQKPGEGMR